MALPNPAAGIPQNAAPMNYKDPVVEEIRDVKLSLQEAVTTGLKAGFMTTGTKFLEKIPILGKGLVDKIEFEKRKMFEAQGRDPLTGRKLTKEELEERDLRKKSMGATARIDDNVVEILDILTKHYGPSAQDLSEEEKIMEQQRLDRETQEELQVEQQTFFEKLFGKHFGPGEGGIGSFFGGGGGGGDQKGDSSMSGPLKAFLASKALRAAAGTGTSTAAAGTAAAGTAATTAGAGAAAAGTGAAAGGGAAAAAPVIGGIAVAAAVAIFAAILAYKGGIFVDRLLQFVGLKTDEIALSEEGEVQEEPQPTEAETPSTDATPKPAETPPTNLQGTKEDLFVGPPTPKDMGLEGQAAETAPSEFVGPVLPLMEGQVEGDQYPEAKYPYGRAPEGIVQSEWDKAGGSKGYFEERRAKQKAEIERIQTNSKKATDDLLGKDKEKYPYGKVPEGQGTQAEWDKKMSFVGPVIPLREGQLEGDQYKSMEGMYEGMIRATATPAKVPTTSGTLTTLTEQNDALKRQPTTQPIIAPNTNNVVTNNSNTSVMSATSATRTGIDLDERALRRGQ